MTPFDGEEPDGEDVQRRVDDDGRGRDVEPTTETVEAAQVERDRVASVIEACKGHADIMAQAVKEGWTAEKAELACLKAEKAEAEKAKIEAARPSAPSIVNLKAAAGKEADAKMIAAAACLGGAMKESTVERSSRALTSTRRRIWVSPVFRMCSRRWALIIVRAMSPE